MTTRPYPIRDARPEDAPRISAVHQASREALYRGRVSDELIDALSPTERLRRWMEWLARPSVVTLVAEEDGEMVGFCTLCAAADADIRDDRVAEMTTLYVHPAAWRLGWGTALCEALEGRAVELGFRTLVLWVLEMNDRARAFYVTRGFADDGARKLDEAPEPTALLALRYRKNLR